MNTEGTKKVLCIIMTYNRQHLLHDAVDQAYKQTIPVDLVIWNNGPKSHVDIPLFKFNEVQVLHGINKIGLHQRFMPALLYPHEYVMFLDDDLIVGPQFLESALEIIEQNENALVVSMGSVMESPLNKYTINHRIPIVGLSVKNSTPWHLDIGSMGVCVCKRKHVNSVFRNGFIPPHPAEEISFSMMHKIYNKGDIILSPHHKEAVKGIVSFQDEHYDGLTSSPDFFEKRAEAIQSLGHKLGWVPNALSHEEWKPGGEAYRIIRTEK